MNKMHVTFEQEVTKLHKTLEEMHVSHQAELQNVQNNIGLGQLNRGRGNSQFGQVHQDARDPVKAIGDVRRTMHAICQIPKLSHATLSDFDQWKQEMENTITSARTDDPKYNQVNIEFIYSSIDLDLRDQAGELKPSGLQMITHISPKAYLEDLERIFTPSDHLSAKRGEFEGRRQQITESPMAYLSIMLRLYNRAQFNDETYLVERFLAGLLNETLKLQLILHYKHVTNYETMRAAVVECHAALVKAIRIGKGTPTFSVTGLTQQSDVASSETFAQWKRRSKPGNKDSSEPMDLSQIDPHNTEVLFFMGHDDLQLRDNETEEDLAYWEDDLASEDTTITEMIRGRTDSKEKTCYHCNAVGHFKAQCPQRRQAPGKPHDRPFVYRGRGGTRSSGPPSSSRRGAGPSNSWSRGAGRGRGRNFDNRAGVAQITEIKDDDDPETVEAPQNPEQDF